MTPTAITSIPASVTDWMLAISPSLGIAIVVAWCIWKCISWFTSNFSGIDKRLDQHDHQITNLDRRLTNIEADVKTLTVSVHKIETHLAVLETKIDARFEEIDRRFDIIDKKFETFEKKFEAQNEFNVRVLTLLEANQKTTTQVLQSVAKT